MTWLTVGAALRKVPAFAWLSVVLFVALAVQTARIEGFKVWPIHVSGLKAALADTTQQLGDVKAAFATTVSNYRHAAEQARAADAANLARVKAAQAQINQETSDAFEARIADARAHARRLQQQADAAKADSGSRGTAPVPGVPAAAGVPAEAAGESGLPQSDALTATEQAIQLDELIKWVRRQAGIDANGQGPPATATPNPPTGR